MIIFTLLRGLLRDFSSLYSHLLAQGQSYFSISDCVISANSGNAVLLGVIVEDSHITISYQLIFQRRESFYSSWEVILRDFLELILAYFGIKAKHFSSPTTQSLL